MARTILVKFVVIISLVRGENRNVKEQWSEEGNNVNSSGQDMDGPKNDDKPRNACYNADDGKDESPILLKYPYVASIQRKGVHYTSGALVNNKWVLSSAGEFYNVRESIRLFKVRLGSVDCKRGGILLPIRSIEIHPNFVPKMVTFDVSLLQLAAPVESSQAIKPIRMSDTMDAVVAAKFLAFYWPRVVTDKRTLPEKAQEWIQHNGMRISTQHLIPASNCSVIMEGYNEVLEANSLCLKPLRTYHSPCMPDSGAPIVAEGVLWGITSGWVPPTCPHPPGPTIVSRVSSVPIRSWINKQLSGLTNIPTRRKFCPPE